MDKNIKKPFYIDMGRAMISLGPLYEKKYCSYSCAFCYVQNGFWRYEKMSIDDICAYLRENEDQFDIIYISGDTDSFAPPRTKMGVDLLIEISKQFNKDILFTTRMVFDTGEFERIKEVNQLLKSKGKSLFGCISISSPIEERRIEPLPIPSKADRLNQLQKFKKQNIFSVLAMRPFLPIYTYKDYVDLIDETKGKVDCILGERWFFHDNDIIYNRVMAGQEIKKGKIVSEKMDFDNNQDEWKVWYDAKMEENISNYCAKLEIPFFMRSSPAIYYLKNKKVNAIDLRGGGTLDRQ